jgi:hypothetical protein
VIDARPADGLLALAEEASGPHDLGLLLAVHGGDSCRTA